MSELDRIHDEHVKNSDPCPECGSLIRRDWEWAYLYQHATTCSRRGVPPAREFGEAA